MHECYSLLHILHICAPQALVMLLIYTHLTADVFDVSQQESTGVANNINDGTVPFKCVNKPCQWDSMHNMKAL